MLVREMLWLGKHDKKKEVERSPTSDRVFAALCLMPSLWVRHLPSMPEACLALCLAFTGE